MYSDNPTGMENDMYTSEEAAATAEDAANPTLKVPEGVLIDAQALAIERLYPVESDMMA
jgi:hypothetical protein